MIASTRDSPTADDIRYWFMSGMGASSIMRYLEEEARLDDDGMGRSAERGWDAEERREKQI